MSIYEEKIDKIFHECNKHIMRIDYAAEKIKEKFPLNKKSYEELTQEEVQVLDQFLFRFSKLQDAMGEKLFKTLLFTLDEKVENRPFIDILNRLEKLEILEAQEWRKLRDARNELAHNYDDEPEEMSIAINNVFNKKDKLKEIYQAIVKYYLKVHTKI